MVAVVPADDFLRIFVALGELFDLGLDLLRLGFQAIGLHDFCQHQAQLHATLGLLREHLGRDRHVLGVRHAARLEVAAGHFNQALLVLLDQRLRHVQLCHLQQRFHDLVLEQCVRAALDFTLEVFADVGAHLVEVAVGDAQRLREGFVDFRQVCPLDLLERNGELSRLTGDVLAVVVLGECQGEFLRLALLQAQRGLFELGQHAAFAQHEAETFSLAAGKFHAVDRTHEIDRYAVAILCNRCTAVAVLAGFAARVVVHALLAQDVEGLVDLGIGDFGLGAGQFCAGQIAELDFRIHLEGGVERDLVIGHAFGLQLKARLAGNLHALLVGDVEELTGSLVVADFEFDLLAVLLLDHLHRDLARAEAGHLDGLGQTRQTALLLLLHFGLRDSQGHFAIKLAEVFDSRHGRNSRFRRWLRRTAQRQQQPWFKVLGLAGLAGMRREGRFKAQCTAQRARSGWQTQNAYYGMERSAALIFWLGMLGKPSKRRVSPAVAQLRFGWVQRSALASVHAAMLAR